MVGSRDLPPSTAPSFLNIFFHNQFRAKPQWPDPSTNLSGQTAIVTGSNTGLGYAAAAQLLDLKLSRMILAVRSAKKGEVAASRLRTLHPEAIIEVWQLDMSSYDSIQAFARLVESQSWRADIVILNAGVMNLEYTTTKSTGHEETVQVNYLSTMLLAILLLPVLKAKRSARGDPAHLTIVSAALTFAARFPNRNADPLLPAFDDPKRYEPREQYMSSRVLGQMFLWKLIDYISADDVIVNLADPAWCKGTDLHRDAKGAVKVGMKIFGAVAGRTTEVGASCYVDAVVNKGKESHGCFIMSWELHPYACFPHHLDCC
jgi:NAD(P)-dependent dehydrogenase (short-subunit alcohol dehydrogenase family)